MTPFAWADEPSAELASPPSPPPRSGASDDCFPSLNRGVAGPDAGAWGFGSMEADGRQR
jgi:hypothetical protein